MEQIMKHWFLYLSAILIVGVSVWGCVSQETREEVKKASMALADARVAFAQKFASLELDLGQNRISKEDYDLALSLARSELKLAEEAYKASVDKAAAESKENVGNALHKGGDFIDILAMILPMFFPYAAPLLALLSQGVRGAANTFGPRPQVIA